MAAAEVKPHITGFDMNVMRNPAGERKSGVKACVFSQRGSRVWLCDSRDSGKRVRVKSIERKSESKKR